MKRSFGAHTTTDELLEGLDLSGTRVFVTGVSSGLGLETARAAAAHGAEVVGTARDLDKARVAIEPFSDLAIDVVECDLASLASVRACADSLTSLGAPFDVVVANAGVMNCPLGRTVDGFETHVGTNHLGHFLLVNRIAGLIREGGRVIVLTSMAHHTSDVDLDDPGFERTAIRPVPGVWAVQDRQRPLRDRAGPAPRAGEASAASPCNRAASAPRCCATPHPR